MLSALEILSKHGMQDTEEGAKTYNNLGLVYSLRSDFAKSAEMFESAGLVRKQTNTLQMPMNARRLYNFASMRLKQSRGTSGSEAEHWILEAQKLFQEALDILADYEPWPKKETFSDFFVVDGYLARRFPCFSGV